MKTRIDVEEIVRLQKRLDEINKLNVTEIDFYRDNQRLVIPEETLENWRFVGLNTTYFALLELHK